MQQRILIVDDEPGIREIIASVFGSMNYLIEEAADGKAALEKLKAEKFDLVFCDISMPRMSGLDCFEKSREEGMNVPFVFVTSYGDNLNIAKAVRLGAFDFILKPFDLEVIERIGLKVLNRDVKQAS